MENCTNPLGAKTMKKLIAWEFILTVLCILAYFGGLVCGLTPHNACLVAAIVATIATAIAALAAVTNAAALAPVANTDSFAAAFAAAVVAIVVVATIATAITAFVAIVATAITAAIVYDETRLKYHIVFLSLVIEEVAIFAVFRYGHLILPK